MLSSHSPQTTLEGNAFKPFEGCEVDSLDQLRRAERPSAAVAARRMLRHWPSKRSKAQLVRRPA
jgi:hypothetical protein